MPPPSEPFQEDPTLQHARREFRLVLVVVGSVMLWAIGVCAFDGYLGQAEPPLLLGMPRWALLGILFPWLFLLGFNYWYGLVFVADDDLSRDDVAEPGLPEPPVQEAPRP